MTSPTRPTLRVLAAIFVLLPSSALAQTVSPNIPYRPFLDPLPLHAQWWIFLFPLALAIAVVYKAVQTRDMSTWGNLLGKGPDNGGYLRATLVMTLQIIMGMLALGVASYLLVVVYARFIAERLAG